MYLKASHICGCHYELAGWATVRWVNVFSVPLPRSRLISQPLSHAL